MFRMKSWPTVVPVVLDPTSMVARVP